MHWLGTPENFSSLKCTSIALDFAHRANCLEALVSVQVLAGLFLVRFIRVRCLASRLNQLTLFGTIVELVGI